MGRSWVGLAIEISQDHRNAMKFVIYLFTIKACATWIAHLYYGYWYGYILFEGLSGVIIPPLILVRHLGSKLLARHLALWLDCVLSTIEVASVTYILARVILEWRSDSYRFYFTRITLCAATCLTLLLLLFNLARGLWTLHSGKTGRWSMRLQHLDNRSSARSGPESFFEALRRLNRALFGQYLLRRRFKFEETSIRIARSLSAICLLVTFVLAAYDVLIIQPFSYSTSVPSARYLRTSMDLLPLTDRPWTVNIELLTAPKSMQDDINVHMTWTNVIGLVHNLTCPAINSSAYQCPSISDDVPDFIGELFIGANFTATTLAFENGSEFEKGLHGNMGPLMIWLQYGTADNVGSSYPLLVNNFMLFPNVHIRATLAITHRQIMTNEKTAPLGLQKIQDSYIFNIDKITPDPDPPISGGIFSSLRIFIPKDISLVPGSDSIIKEVKSSTILTGTSILGGLWTFMTGVFSLIFGSSLLLVLFGIKPLSVYGFVHLLQGGGVSLAEGTPLTDEEQARTVAILREHLMDVGDRNAEGLTESGNGSNGAEVIESQESLMSERQEIDLERGSEAVNPQGPGDVRQEF